MRNTKFFGFLKRKYNRWVWKNLPPCKEIVPMISQSQDEKLSLRKRIEVKMHLAACTPCVRYLQQIKFLSEAFHKCDEKVLQTETKAKLSDDARERIKNTLKSAAVILALTFI